MPMPYGSIVSLLLLIAVHLGAIRSLSAATQGVITLVPNERMGVYRICLHLCEDEDVLVMLTARR